MRRNSHDFFKMMGAVKEGLANDYRRIRTRTVDDPGTAGDQAEEDWASILRNWLPATYPVVTKGRILFDDGTSSPQVDVLILKPSYPHGLRSQKYFFAGGVIAAFECKLTLRQVHIREAFRAACKIKRKARSRSATPYDELNRSPIYGLLAHSLSFHSKHSSWKLYDTVERYQTTFAKHPSELLDIICVADVATLPLGKHVLVGNDLDQEERDELAESGGGGADLVSTMYVIHDEDTEDSSSTGAILAGLVHELTFRLAFEDPSVREWADHLSYLGSYLGIGRNVYWTADHLSSRVRRKLKTAGREMDRWSKWSRSLP